MKKHNVVILRSGPVDPYPAVEKLTSALVEQGFGVTVLAWDRNGDTDKEGVLQLAGGAASIVRFGIPATFSGGLRKNLLPLLRFQRKLLRWLRCHRDEYDVIHAFDLDTGLAAKYAARRWKKKLVYQIQDFYAACRCREGGTAYRALEKLEFSVVNFADAVTVCTEARKAQLMGSRPKSLTVLHNAPRPIGKIEPMPLSGQAVRIVYAGVLLEHRLLEELMDAVEADARFELHIAGFGMLADLVKSRAAACGRIVFHGKLPYNEVLSLESACHIMTALYDPAVANHRYAAPNKVYEAMMLGKPLLMCKNTGWDTVLAENGLGELIEYSRSGVEIGLKALMQKRHLWEQTAQRGRELYEREYNWEIMKGRILEIYERF